MAKLWSIKNFKKVIFVLAFLCFVIYAVKQPKTKKFFLDLVGRLYFDNQYYVESYPEVKTSKLSPFKHYSKIGWLEGKNPNKYFDNNFYRRIYNSWDRSFKGLNPLQHYVQCKIKLKECYANPSQLKKATLLTNPKYYLALTSIFSNEARFLKEWIEFYRLMGVEHFYLYNNLSTDNYMEILEPYIKEGIVELEDVSEKSKDTNAWNVLQTKMYTEAAKKTSDLAEWLVVVDSDEFLYPIKDINLIELLKRYDSYATLSVNFINFGSSNVKSISSDQLIIERLLYSEEQKNLHTSPIVKPRYVEYFDCPHFAKLKEGYAQVTENYKYIYGPFSPYQSMKIVAGNHYWARDWNFFESTKLKRIHLKAAYLDYYSKEKQAQERSEKQQLIELNKNFSKVYSDSILRFVPELRKRVFSVQNSN